MTTQNAPDPCKTPPPSLCKSENPAGSSGDSLFFVKPPAIRAARGLFPAVLTLLLLMSSLFAQQLSGGLRGQVVDEVGALVIGAQLTVVAAGGSEQSTTTDQRGNYLFPLLKPGKYTLRIASPGFAVLEISEVEISPGPAQVLNATLSVAAVTQEVTVPTEAGINVAPENNASAIKLSGAVLDSMPDDPDDLAAALAALAGPASGPGGGELVIDGFTGSRMPSRDSIREIRVNSNPFSAEYSRLGYGRIEVFTKPGTNNFHGQGFLNSSAGILNSRNPFAGDKQPYRYFFYGGNVSGPLLAKRASFFADFDRRDINENNVVNAIVLDSAFNPTPLALAVVAPQHRTTFSVRLDLLLNQSNTIVVRYSNLQMSLQNVGVGNFSLPARGHDARDTGQTFQFSETAILNPTTINETRFQYVGQRGVRRGLGVVPTINVLDSFIDGGSELGGGSNQDDRFELQNYTTLARNNHTFKVGARVRDIRIADVSPTNFTGTFVFAGGVAPQLDANNQLVRDETGQPIQINITSIERYRRTQVFLQQGLTPTVVRELGGGASQYSLALGNPKARAQRTDFHVFLQDDWTVTGNLTLALGLRYEVQNNVNDKLNFAPRIAFGYAPLLDRKGRSRLVIRGGLGIFYDSFGENLILQTHRFDGFTEQRFVSTDPLVLDTFPVGPTVTNITNPDAAQTTVQQATDLRIPRIIQGALSVEHQFPFNIVVSTTFISTHISNALRSRNINAPLPGTFDPDVPDSGVRPLGSSQGDIFQYESTGRFNLNQLAIGVRNPSSSKFSFFANYSLTRARSDTDGPNSFPASSYDLASEYGRSALDILHRLDLGGVITLRHGFSLNPFVLASSGRPFNITTGLDTNGDTLFTERPSFATNANQPGITATSLGLFNPRPEINEPLVPRNYGASPAFFSVNLRLSKTFAFGESPGRQGTATLSPQPRKASTDAKDNSDPKKTTPSTGLARPPERTDFIGNSAPRPYNLAFSVVARNIFNRTNPGVAVGNLNSPFFGRSNFLAPPYGFGEGGESNAANRRLELQVRFSF